MNRRSVNAVLKWLCPLIVVTVISVIIVFVHDVNVAMWEHEDRDRACLGQLLGVHRDLGKWAADNGGNYPKTLREAASLDPRGSSLYDDVRSRDTVARFVNRKYVGYVSGLRTNDSSSALQAFIMYPGRRGRDLRLADVVLLTRGGELVYSDLGRLAYIFTRPELLYGTTNVAAICELQRRTVVELPPIWTQRIEPLGLSNGRWDAMSTDREAGADRGERNKTGAGLGPLR